MTRLIDADKFGVISLQGKSEDFIEGVKFILEKIDEAPTVEWPHGEWKFDGKGANYCNFYICSLCGCTGNQTCNFCPSCGAKMQVTDENTQKHYGFRKKY